MNRTIPCEDLLASPDFKRLSAIAGIRVDLRYATPANFTGRDLYSPLDCAWLHRTAAAALETSVKWLKKARPELHLLVLDALRPQRVQEELWASLAGTNLQEYLADPVDGSMHSFGMAVDITLVDAAGEEFDMGAGFDEMSERSHPAREEALLARGELTAAHIENRKLLRETMQHGGWHGINSEWWHFDCDERARVRAGFVRVM